MTAGDDSRRRVEAALLEESAEDLYEHAPCAYLSTLPDGTIVRVNQTFAEWTGVAVERLLAGTTFQSLLSVGSRIYYETHYAPLLRMHGAVNEVALEVIRGDGRITPVLVNATQRLDDSGLPLFNRITLFDATERRRYERELLVARRKAEQVAKDKEHLLAMLSHDIRNPLNAFMGVVQMLDGGVLTESQRRSVRLLKSSSEHMLNLLNHVLELSRAESSTFALVETEFSLRQVAGDVIGAFETVAKDKGLELTAAVADDVPPVMLGDPVAIRQILTNLVANAVKFTVRGSVRLTIGRPQLATDTATLAIAVTDTGIGIAPEVIDRLFRDFTQASYETAMRFGGTGLGLAITRRLLALYGTTIDVASVPGEGTTFSFSLRLPVPLVPAG